MSTRYTERASGASPGAGPAHEAGTRSRQVMDRARALMPGGVNSPVRAFAAVGGEPRVIESGSGARIRDVDGREYLDYLGSWGPLILGHAHPDVVAAVKEAASGGTSFGAPTQREVELAELVCEMVPSIERVRMVSSGTEAAVSALRLARGATGRELIVKVEGCYHGHADPLLVKAGSGPMTLGIPDSPGVPAALARLTLTVPFNDPEALEKIFSHKGKEIACLILEPVAGNMGVIAPQPGYLQAARDITSRHGALLIFDEVMTGFRVAPGGAQQLYDVQPDLTMLGKIIGGGLPVGAYGGAADLMARVAPEGPVYQAGTLSGNPVSMAAGLATLWVLRRPGLYERLEALSARLESGVREAARQAGIPVWLNRVGSMMCAFFTHGPVTDFASAMTSDTRRYAAYFHAMLRQGINLAPSQFEATFVSAAHTEADIDATIAAAREALGV